HDDDQNHINDGEDDTDSDDHTDTTPAPASGTEQKADDDHFDDKANETDNYSANDSQSTSVVIPVTGGTMSVGSGTTLQMGGLATEQDEAKGEDNSGAPATNHETDTVNLTNNDGGTAGYN